MTYRQAKELVFPILYGANVKPEELRRALDFLKKTEKEEFDAKSREADPSPEYEAEGYDPDLAV